MADPQTQRSELDPAAWLDAHGDALLRFALLRVRDRDAAEELVQECFVAGLSAHEEFSGRSSERTWLIGILKRKIVDHYRRNNSQAAGEAVIADQAAGEAGFTEKGLWQRGPKRWRGDPQQAIQQSEFQATLRGCIEALPDGLVDTFLLREMDGLTSEEICQVLDITPTNLWARLHRARLSLRQCLESRWFGQRKST